MSKFKIYRYCVWIGIKVVTEVRYLVKCLRLGWYWVWLRIRAFKFFCKSLVPFTTVKRIVWHKIEYFYLGLPGLYNVVIVHLTYLALDFVIQFIQEMIRPEENIVTIDEILLEHLVSIKEQVLNLRYVVIEVLSWENWLSSTLYPLVLGWVILCDSVVILGFVFWNFVVLSIFILFILLNHCKVKFLVYLKRFWVLWRAGVLRWFFYRFIILYWHGFYYIGVKKRPYRGYRLVKRPRK